MPMYSNFTERGEGFSPLRRGGKSGILSQTGLALLTNILRQTDSLVSSHQRAGRRHQNSSGVQVM